MNEDICIKHLQDFCNGVSLYPSNLTRFLQDPAKSLVNSDLLNILASSKDISFYFFTYLTVRDNSVMTCI
jgi:hypothetical protein